jgi:hypothetical protein
MRGCGGGCESLHPCWRPGGLGRARTCRRGRGALTTRTAKKAAVFSGPPLPVCIHGSTFNLRVAVPVPAAFAAFNFTLEVPGAAGAPEIKPLLVSTERPAGRAVAA